MPFSIDYPYDPIALLRTMTLSREGDRREGILFRQGRGWLQVPAAGHEALAVIHDCLESQDFVFPYCRERALVLARGVTNYQLALSFFARAGSWSEGRMMSGHYSDPALNIMASATPTGAQCLPAVGAAWASKLKGESRVTLCCTGDAGLRQGEFYEAWCFALQENLPVVFVVEDNGYGISTPTHGMTPWNIGALDPQRLLKVDGRRVEVVYDAARQLVQKARRGEGPGVLWMEIDRLWPHTGSDDHRIYRTADELQAMTGRDPVELFKARLVAERILTEDSWRKEQEAIAQAVEDDYIHAEAATLPESKFTNVEIEIEARAATSNWETHPCDGTEQTMLDALNHSLHRIFERDERTIYFGQDVEDPKGGVFGLTKGLSSNFSGRVFNSPLAEATIVGTAVGLAIAGLKPIFEIQFVDFIGTAFNQLSNQAASLRWRSADGWRCPAIFIMPCGAYLPAGGPWHSQSNEALFAHIPGLLVAYPSTAQDAVDLLEIACHLQDPVVFLLPKHLLRRKAAAPVAAVTGFGAAAVRRSGDDVTIVSWGNCVEVSIAAAELLSQEGISAEVLDLRTLVPCDWMAIQASLEKTGRLVVVQEDNETCSFGQAIITRATTDADFWNQLAARPQLVTRPDSYIPFNPELEAALLPSPDDVYNAVLATLAD